METVIGLNLNHHDTCLFTKSIGAEGLSEFQRFLHDTLCDAERVVTLRLEDRKSLAPCPRNAGMIANRSEEYQYATMSAYSPTMSEMPLKCKLAFCRGLK